MQQQRTPRTHRRKVAAHQKTHIRAGERELRTVIGADGSGADNRDFRERIQTAKPYR
jgi:hypothetical protein